MCRGDTRTCTWTVNAHPLCQSYYGCPNGTVTKHGSTGHEWREWQNVYITRAVTFTVTYMDTLTEGVGERVAVRVQYTCCHSYCVLHGYSDRGGWEGGGVGERVAVHVLYTYCQSLPYPPLSEYSCKSQ